MEAPFSLEPLLERYRGRRPAIQAIYQRMYEEAHRLVQAASLQQTWPAAELPLLAACLPGAGMITLWVNGLARQMHLKIREAARKQGCQASPAYRPGIGRWPVELQDQIFCHLPAAEVGVQLLPDFIMAPQKSVSLIVAVGAKLGRNCYAPGGTQ
jgi:hypothetical protein